METTGKSSPNGQMCKSAHSIYKEGCKDCRGLQKEWYQYLTNTGFKDVEKEKDWRTQFGFEFTDETQSTTQDVFNAKVIYSSWAQEKLNLNKFPTEKDKLIWECHVEGQTTREIAPKIDLNQSWISRRISYMRKCFKQHDIGSGSFQMDLLFWGEPWAFVKRAS